MTSDPKGRPPYVPFRVFKNAIAALRPMPSMIDYSLFPKMSGTTRRYLFSALRFFSLIDPDNAPSRRLKAMAGEDAKAWSVNMAALIREYYRPDQLAALESGSYERLRALFEDDPKRVTSTTKAVCRFLIDAAVDVEIPVSTAIVDSIGGRIKSRLANETFEGTSAETIAFPLPIHGKALGKIVVPRGLSESDLPMFNAIVAAVVAYAKHNTGENSEDAG